MSTVKNRYVFKKRHAQNRPVFLEYVAVFELFNESEEIRLRIGVYFTTMTIGFCDFMRKKKTLSLAPRVAFLPT